VLLYAEDIERLTADLTVKEQALGAGNIRGPEVEAVRNLLRDREVQLRESKIRQGDIRRQLATLELERSNAADAAEAEQLKLEDQRSDIELSVQTESEVAPINLRMPRDGLLVPRGFRIGQTVTARPQGRQGYFDENRRSYRTRPPEASMTTSASSFVKRPISGFGRMSSTASDGRQSFGPSRSRRWGG
jgi:hypothetical protein